MTRLHVDLRTGAIHHCTVPMRRLPIACTPPILVPVGDDGDVWRCEECGKLWQVLRDNYDDRQWFPAAWWTRWQFRKVGLRPAQHRAG